jgi:hypothetical protein
MLRFWTFVTGHGLLICIVTLLFACKPVQQTPKSMGSKTQKASGSQIKEEDKNDSGTENADSTEKQRQSTSPLRLLEYMGSCLYTKDGEQTECFEAYIDRSLGYVDYIRGDKLCDMNGEYGDSRTQWSDVEKCPNRYAKGCKSAMGATVFVSWKFKNKEPCQAFEAENYGE